MKKLLLFFMVLCIANANAQSFNETTVRQQIENAAANMKTMQCDFVQTKTLRMLNDKMVSNKVINFVGNILLLIYTPLY